MQVFGYTVPDEFMMNPFYVALRRGLHLRRPGVFSFELDYDEAVFNLTESEVETAFTDFVGQPFIDEDLLKATERALGRYETKFRIKQIFFNRWMPPIIIVLASIFIGTRTPPEYRLRTVLGLAGCFVLFDVIMRAQIRLENWLIARSLSYQPQPAPSFATMRRLAHHARSLVRERLADYDFDIGTPDDLAELDEDFFDEGDDRPSSTEATGS